MDEFKYANFGDRADVWFAITHAARVFNVKHISNRIIVYAKICLRIKKKFTNKKTGQIVRI